MSIACCIPSGWEASFIICYENWWHNILNKNINATCKVLVPCFMSWSQKEEDPRNGPFTQKAYLSQFYSCKTFCFTPLFSPILILSHRCKDGRGRGRRSNHVSSKTWPAKPRFLTPTRLTRKPAAPICRRKHRTTDNRSQPAGSRPATRSR
jgi:hypothetical protein